MERHAAGKVQEEKNEENIHLLFHDLKVLNIHMDEKGNILGYCHCTIRYVLPKNRTAVPYVQCAG